MEECLEDPDGALAELQDEQRRIADELERTFLAYDKKLQAAAKRIASLGPEGVTAEARDQLRAEQLELWRLLRRAQAAERGTRELVREAREWKAHGPTAAPEGHPDHPETRVEIVESELRVRGMALPDTPQMPDVAEEEEASLGLHWLHRVPEEVQQEVLSVPLPEWEHDTDEHLLREIHTHERELARTQAPAEIADLMRSLRTLHGHLRIHDRRTGRPRYRYLLGFGAFHH